MKQLAFITFLFFSIISQAQEAPKGLSEQVKAPVFAAKDQTGSTINLEDQLKKGSVVLVFARGHWCPYCNKQLKRFEDSLPQIKAKGASLIAVTPEKPEYISKLVAKTKATYPILFDDGLHIMKSYDVAFEVDNATITSYKKYGIEFTTINGLNGNYLPVPAIYVINKEGAIVFRHYDSDFRKMASIREVLAHL